MGEKRGTLGRENFPLFNMATESISSELCKCVKDLILLVEQRSFGEPDLIRFRLDWLCNVVVRYVDHIPSGEEVLNLMHEAAVLLVTDSDDDHGNPNVSIEAETLFTGQRGRSRYFVSKDKLEFLLNMRFTSGEISSMLCVSESTVKRRIREFESFVRPRYSDISDDDLDHIVERIMREFPNSGYKRMTGLLQNAGHRIQQSRIRECMRRVNPDGVLPKALELRAVRRRRYQVRGPLALWHIDGNHKLIRYNIAFKGCMLERWEHTWRQYISESVDGKICTQPHTLIVHASLSLTLFQKRVEFESQNASIINVRLCGKFSVWPCFIHRKKKYICICVL